MDRNANPGSTTLTFPGVALRKESVDRNVPCNVIRPAIDVSLSARRAWIEISTRNQPGKPKAVALRKESVDRNISIDNLTQGVFVALRKESVDRNFICGSNRTIDIMSLSARRAWIEIEQKKHPLTIPTSLSARRAWIEINMSIVSTFKHTRRSPQGERG